MAKKKNLKKKRKKKRLNPDNDPEETGVDSVSYTLEEERPTTEDFNGWLDDAKHREYIPVAQTEFKELHMMAGDKIDRSRVTKTVDPESGTALLRYKDEQSDGMVERFLIVPPALERAAGKFPQGGAILQNVFFALRALSRVQPDGSGTWVRRSDILDLLDLKGSRESYRLLDACLLTLLSETYIYDNKQKGKKARKHIGRGRIESVDFIGEGRGSCLKITNTERADELLEALRNDAELPEWFVPVPTKQLQFGYGHDYNFLIWLAPLQRWASGKTPYKSSLRTVFSDAIRLSIKNIKHKGPKEALGVLKKCCLLACSDFGWNFVFDCTSTKLWKRLAAGEWKGYVKLKEDSLPWEVWNQIQERTKIANFAAAFRDMRTDFDLLRWKLSPIPPKRKKELTAGK